jgi:capsular polysaccharide biosynthesis protein
MNKILFDSYQVNRNMPANYKDGELDFCKAEFSYQTRSVKLIAFKNVFVNASGYIYQDSWTIHPESLVDQNFIHQFHLKHFIKKVFIKKKRRLDSNKSYLLCFDAWSAEHYHWFCDVLPRIYLLKDVLKDYTMLLPDTAYMKTIGIRILKLLNLYPGDIEFIKPRELVKVKCLSLITKVATTGQINSVLIQNIKQVLSQSVSNNHTPISRKLYITRDKTRYRKVLNEPEILAVLKDFSYETVRYEDLALKEQIEITSECKSLISIHGAGLTNMLFMPANGNVLEFRRNKIYHNQCYWHLADSLNLNYYYLFGTPDQDKVIEGPKGCNLFIPIPDLVSILKCMEK